MRPSKVLLGILFLLLLASIPSHSSAVMVTITGCSPSSAVLATSSDTVTATMNSTTLTFSAPQDTTFTTTPQCILTTTGNLYFIISGSGTSWISSQPAVISESSGFKILSTFTASRSSCTTSGCTGSVDLSTSPLITPQITPDFTVTCLLCFLGPASVFLDTSGGVIKILMDNVIISEVNSLAGCSVTSSGASPCPIQISAKSESGDPLPSLAAGGYPGGVKMSGTFLGKVTNDYVFASGRANGDVVNAVGPGPSDVPVSLPYTLTGCPTCVFTATSTKSAVPSTDTFISEPVTLVCGEATSCPPSLGFALTVGFANTGDSFDPRLIGVGQSTQPLPETFAAFVTPFAKFSAEIDITSLDSVQLKSAFTLNPKSSFACLPNQTCPNRIDASKNEIGLAIGPSFDTAIPAGQFAKSGSGSSTFQGTRDGVTFGAVLKFLGGSDYEFNVQGQGLPLTGLQHPVRLELRINTSDRGRTSN